MNWVNAGESFYQLAFGDFEQLTFGYTDTGFILRRWWELSKQVRDEHLWDSFWNELIKIKTFENECEY